MQVQRYCEELASIIQSFLPGCQDIQKILQARVPLIKYRHSLAGLDCDLSMSSSSGLHMSCLLHVWGDTDWRVRPLVASVRRWAREVRLVRDMRPTQHFTNFTLTMLVVCFLQQKLQMLPPFSALVEAASEDDDYFCQDGVNVRFLHNISGQKEKLNKCFHSKVSMLELLKGFFDFYASYSFDKNALCPISGSSRQKNVKWKHSSALDIFNPLEPQLNVSYNVSRAALKDFQEECKVARDKLDLLEKEINDGGKSRDGLFCIFDGKSSKGAKSRDPRRVILPSVGELFELDQQRKDEVTKSVEKDKVEQRVEPEADISPALTNSGVNRNLKINVGSLFSGAPSKSKRSKKSSSTSTSTETQRVEQLKTKYLRPNTHKNFNYKL